MKANAVVKDLAQKTHANAEKQAEVAKWTANAENVKIFKDEGWVHEVGSLAMRMI